jgi:hypothetical protein
MRNGVKALLVVLSLAAGYEQYLARLAQLSTSSVWMGVAYLGLLTLLSLALLAAAFVQSGLLRWLYAVLFASAATFWDANLRVTGEFPAYDAFVSEIDAFSFVNEALSHYWLSILAAAASALLLLVGIGLRPGHPQWRWLGSRAGEEPEGRAQTGSSLLLTARVSMVAAAPAIALLLLTVMPFARRCTCRSPTSTSSHTRASRKPSARASTSSSRTPAARRRTTSS